ADAHPDARIDVAFGEDRYGKVEAVVRRIARSLARVEDAAAGAADKAAGAELLRPFWTDDAGADGAVLQRGSVVVELDQLRQPAADLLQRIPDLRSPIGFEIGRDAARHDAVRHQAMTEACGRCAQHLLAQDSTMRVLRFLTPQRKSSAGI